MPLYTVYRKIFVFHKNYNNSQNIPPVITTFQGLFKYMKRHVLTIFSKQLNVFCLCYRHASFFPFFIFSKVPATYAFPLYVT